MTGQSVHYILSPVFGTDVRWILFCDLVNETMKRTPECVDRSQVLPVTRSVALCEQLILTHSEKAELFAKKSHFEQFLTKEYEVPNEGIDFTTTESLCEWFETFGARFAAFSLLQTVSNSPVPNPFDLLFDFDGAGVVCANLEAQLPAWALVRMCGKLAAFCQRPLLCGPMRLGLMTAAQAITLNMNRVMLFREAVLGKGWDDCREFVQAAVGFSVRDSDPRDVEERIRELVHRSEARSRELFTIPWI
jgi:hypothetical protein